MAGLQQVVTLCMDLDEHLTETDDKVQRVKTIQAHLKKIDQLNFKIPGFKEGLDWLNVSEPLSLSNQLSGKLLVLDFFTYCCINCMHVLPDLEHLETKFTSKDGVVIVGVHSAKFLNEKVTANILSAVLRYNIEHPVVNDADASLWQQLEISCWPTFLLVGPEGQYIYAMVGEGHREKLLEFVEVAVKYYEGRLNHSEMPVHLEKDKVTASALSFPGKVCTTVDGDVVVADTGNNRILVLAAKTGVVQTVIGGKEAGFVDGDFKTARFSGPQGVVAWQSHLYVADKDNHSVRQVDLKSGQVMTVVGTGRQGTDKEGGNCGTEQEIASPWDLALGWMDGATAPNVLYIAMAGTHQIWVYFLRDTRWYKSSEHKAGTCLRFAGSGNEENRNNSYPAKAGFAQPSGLAVSSMDVLHAMFVADAESSTVRMVMLKDGAVKALVGGERDPTNLFAYGDTDGKGVEAKLQHPLGVALVTDGGPLLVADSYNHKIKSIDIKTKECTTLIGHSEQERQLNEPGGICVDLKRKLVYIADTNNHSIKTYNFETKTLSDLPVIFDTSPNLIKVDIPDTSPEVDVTLTTVEVKPGGHLNLTLTLDLESGSSLNEDAPNIWKLASTDPAGKEIIAFNSSKGKLTTDTTQTITRLVIPDTNSTADLVFTFQLWVCGSKNTCVMKRHVVLQPLQQTSTATENASTDIHLKLTS